MLVWKHVLQSHLFWNLFQVELHASLQENCIFCHPLQRLLNWCINLVIIVNSTMGVGRGSQVPLDFENFSKKGCFPSFKWEKKFHNIWPPLQKYWKSTLCPPPWKKSFRRQWTPHDWVWNGLELSTTTFAVLSLVYAGWTEVTSETHFGYQKCFFFS